MVSHTKYPLSFMYLRQLPPPSENNVSLQIERGLLPRTIRNSAHIISRVPWSRPAQRSGPRASLQFEVVLVAAAATRNWYFPLARPCRRPCAAARWCRAGLRAAPPITGAGRRFRLSPCARPRRGPCTTARCRCSSTARC